MTVQVFIATHGDFDKTEKFMCTSLQKTSIKNIKNHITKTLKAAKNQFTKNFAPVSSANAPSWKTPKPSATDYSQPCHPQALGDKVKLVDLSFDTID